MSECYSGREAKNPLLSAFGTTDASLSLSMGHLLVLHSLKAQDDKGRGETAITFTSDIHPQSPNFARFALLRHCSGHAFREIRRVSVAALAREKQLRRRRAARMRLLVS